MKILQVSRYHVFYVLVSIFFCIGLDAQQEALPSVVSNVSNFSPAANTALSAAVSSEDVTKEEGSKPDETIYLNFEDTSLESVFNYLAEQKKINVAPHKDMADVKVSLTTRKPMSLDRAWDVLLTLLEMNGYSIVNVDNLYRIVSNNANGQEPLPTYSSKTGTKPDDLPDSDLVIRYIYYFKNIKASVAQSILETMLEGDNKVKTNQDLQVCIIKEKSLNIKAAMKIITELDLGGLRESIKILPLREANAADIEQLFQEIVGEPKEQNIRFIAADNRKESSYFSASTRIIAYPAKNALILLGTEKNLNKVADFIYKYIDVPLGTAESRLHIKEPRYISAQAIQPILSSIIKPPAGQKTDKSPVVGKYKFFEDVSIVVDSGKPEEGKGGGNRLVIACNADDWKRLSDFIDQIDKPEPQIVLEVLIADVNLDDIRQLGADVQNKLNKPVGAGIQEFFTSNLTSGVTATQQTTGGKTTTALTGVGEDLIQEIPLLSSANNANFASFLTLGKAGAGVRNIWAVIMSVITANNGHTIQQPYLIANNNQECYFEVSSTQKVLSALQSNRGEPSRSTKKDAKAGTILTITPRINGMGTVTLKINLEASSFQPNPPVVGAPTTSVRTINTRVAMAAGQVLVLGGLTKNTVSDTRYKTPVLGDIPLIGNLFRNKKAENQASNLYIFIRPSIIEPRFEGSPDEYTQLKLDYAKLNILRSDSYLQDTNPIQRWFFKPENYSIKQKLSDIKLGRLREIDRFTYGQDRPMEVDLARDPYFRSSDVLQEQRTVPLKSRLTQQGMKNA